MLGILLSLVPLISWGISDYIAAKGSKEVNSFSLSFYFMVAGFLATVPIGLVISAPSIFGREILLFFFASVCFNSGFIVMLRAFTYGPVGLVAPIANSYALVTTIYSILFLADKLTVPTVCGIFVITAGIAMVSYSKPTAGEFKNMRKSLMFALTSLILFGGGFLFLDAASTQAWNQNMVLVQGTGFIVATLILLIFRKKDRRLDFRKAAKRPAYFLGGAIGGLGLLGMINALEYTDSVAIPTAIGAAAPLMTALLAYFIDGEHLTLLQRFATFMIVAGIIILGIT